MAASGILDRVAGHRLLNAHPYRGNIMFRRQNTAGVRCFSLIQRGVERITTEIRTLARDVRGNAVMMMSFAAIPVLAMTGVGIDYSRAYFVQQRLSHAIDSAALAVGTAQNKTEAELTQIAQSYFNANYPAAELGVPGNLNVTFGNDTVGISATASVHTTLMGLVGTHHVNVSADTEVTRKITGVELVMVLDNTGSMSSNGKIDALKTAAKDLVEVLFGDKETHQYLKVGLVPFAAAVNVGTQYENSGWIDRTAQSSVHGYNFKWTNNIKNRFDLYDKLTNKSWNGCVEARPMPMDIEDTPPDGSNGDTLWVPYFAPDEPDYDEYYNSYLDDKAKSGWSNQKRQEKLKKYKNESVSGDGPHYNCKTKPITPLTSTKSAVIDAINDMNATGTTNIPFGLAWGWRVISPGEPFTEGVSYDNAQYRKVLILLTDGQNVIGSADNHNESRYGAYGFVKDERLGTNSSSEAQAMLDSQTAEVCNNIKNADADRPILVYTITFQLDDGDTKDLMRNCATDPEKYFDSVSNAVLKQHFEAIAGELSELRLSK